MVYIPHRELLLCTCWMPEEEHCQISPNYINELYTQIVTEQLLEATNLPPLQSLTTNQHPILRTNSCPLPNLQFLFGLCKFHFELAHHRRNHAE